MKGTAHSPPPTANDATPVYRIFLHFPSLLTAGFLLLNRAPPELLKKQKKYFQFQAVNSSEIHDVFTCLSGAKAQKAQRGKKQTNKQKPNKN